MRIITVLHPNATFRDYQVTKLVATDWNHRGHLWPRTEFKGTTDFGREVVLQLSRLDGIEELGLDKFGFNVGKAEAFKWTDIEPTIIQILTETAKKFWPDEEIEIRIKDDRKDYKQFNGEEDWTDYSFLE